ncbi:MAG: sigma-70 family RNA polymerase sigma factor, partial [Bacteroidota bacterium]
MIAALITRMGGSANDVEDIFQETLFILVKNIRDPEFKLTSKVSTYMHAISRNLWLKKGQKGKKEIHMPGEDLLNFSMISEPENNEKEEKELMIGVVFDKINALEDDCKNVIKLTFLKKLSHKEVAELLGYKVAFIKVKKFRCL